MPAGEIEPFLLRGRVRWDELEELNRTWGVSLQSLLVRAHRLGTISDRTYQGAFRHLSRQGWRRNEPVEFGPPEQPQLLRRAFALLERKGVGASDVFAALAAPKLLAKELIEFEAGTSTGVADVVPLAR